MLRVARKFLGSTVMVGVAMAGMLLSPAEAEAECRTDVQCAVENGYDAEVVGVNDIERDDDGCLLQWDCEYEDGTQIRYIPPPPS